MNQNYREQCHIILVALIVVALVIITGCTTLTVEERNDRRIIDRDNWSLCVLAYKQSGRPTEHREHSSEHKYITPIDLKMDLGFNNCEQVLGKHWAPY